MSSAQLLVGVLFHDFSRKRYFSCKNGTQSRKWKGKIKKSVLHPFRRWRLDTAAPIAPPSDIGSAHNLGRGENTSCSCPCPSCGHFQHRRSEQWAPPCVFSEIAAHFLTLSVLENLRFFDPSKRDPESNKTPINNWADFIRFRDEPRSVPVNAAACRACRDPGARNRL